MDGNDDGDEGCEREGADDDDGDDDESPLSLNQLAEEQDTPFVSPKLLACMCVVCAGQQVASGLPKKWVHVR